MTPAEKHEKHIDGKGCAGNVKKNVRSGNMRRRSDDDGKIVEMKSDGCGDWLREPRCKVDQEHFSSTVIGKRDGLSGPNLREHQILMDLTDCGLISGLS